eukprot:CAMPEP_0118851010 /NCGR_PEP_ID=MMETSP1163-20130328/608_1 /TAXON_ID=124430 /ORGANISM="Phaeomonas parva, Strain CCMP2877" /LENGTH=1388 /DNA_ID=CAMNT_0006783265 /DNA_START=379 /DNA_END=4545 /DNA_ORIENTATION=+
MASEAMASEAKATSELTKNKAFMDLYSRQIGAFGIETMSKLVNMKVLIYGLGGVGIETAKNLVLAGPGTVTLTQDQNPTINQTRTKTQSREEDVGSPRARVCAPRLQELNALVRVGVHEGGLTEELVGQHDMLVITSPDLGREELIRWNTFCRQHEVVVPDARGKRVSRQSPIKFICAAAMGALSYVFSDFGDDFLVNDETGEPTVSRTITGISCEEDGIIQLVDPHTSELAQPHNVEDTEHRGYVTLSEVEGMYCKDEASLGKLGHSINSSGPWRVQHVWKTIAEQLIVPRSLGGDGKQREEQFWVRVRDEKTGELVKDADQADGLKRVPKFARECGDLPEDLFVRNEDGSKATRMTRVKDFYKLKIGDTRGYSPYEGGGVLQQVLEPVVHHHKSLGTMLQQPVAEGFPSLMSCDGDKEEKGWWYPLLHVTKQALFTFHATHGRFPTPNDEAEAAEVVGIAQSYNTAMSQLRSFCGESQACSVPLDLAGEAVPAPDVASLPQEKQDAIKSLGEGVGLDEVRAYFALERASWNAEDAMMALFTDPSAMDALAAEKVKVDTFEAIAAIKKFTYAAGVEFQPLCCFIGGIVAQEVVKYTGKFTPLNQWLHFDCVEVLPDSPPPAAAAPAGRYANNVTLFGQDVQDKIMNSKTFMVGCGALGCEFLKNFALLGVATGEQGLVTVTDGDRIEVSNLNRQFLFRSEHVGTPKSTTAAQSVKLMNPAIKVRSLELLAMPSTENVFDDDFWAGSGVPNADDVAERPAGGFGIDFVTNALDSVKARKYVDSRCVFFHKPLLESGTEGTKFNSMVVLPTLTESYDEGDPEPAAGEAIPMCTLRNFPSTIVHCIEWARGQFEDLFVTPVSTLRDFLDDPDGYINNLRENAEAYMMDANDLSKAIEAIDNKEGTGLLTTAKTLAEVKAQGFAACVRLAADLFNKLYNHRMRDLIHQFPRDYVTSDGKPFWVPPKRFPAVLELALAEPTVLAFVISVANLFAVAYGLQPLPENGRNENGEEFDTFVPEAHEWRAEATVRAALAGYAVQDWSPSSEKIETEENTEEAKEAAPAESVEDLIAKLTGLLSELGAVRSQLAGAKAQPADFEKDLDQNFHIDFVSAAANLRGRNYGIKEATRHKVKMIAGKIIPAIATSTACATALVCMELVKLLQSKPKVAFRNSSNSFAINSFQMAEPSDARKVAGRHEEEILPDPVSEPDAFDETGAPLPEYIRKSVWVAVPSPHTKWDRINVPAGTTLGGLVELLESQHSILLAGWTCDVETEDGGKSGVVLYNKPRDAAALGFDKELLLATAPLDLSFQKAQMAILRNKDIKNKQLYSMQWKALQPEQVAKENAFRSRNLADILEEKAGSLSGRKSIELQVNLENADGEEVRTPPCVLQL